MSGDPEQEYFADGMVEDIITALSRFKSLFVIARNSSFTYKGKAVDIKQVGRELGVRYVLEGGVRKAGNRLRISEQLIEAETGVHLWAEKFDGGLADVFDLQDQITDKVVGIAEPSLRKTEIDRSRRKRPDSLDAYDLYLRATPFMASVMPADARKAAAYLEKVLEIDPGYVAAHALLAWCHEICFTTEPGFVEAERLAGVKHARIVIASTTDDASALAIAAIGISHLDRDYTAAVSAIERALSLNASCATALYFGAHVHAYNGNVEVARSYAHRALRLSPFDPLVYEAHMALGFGAVQEARYEEAVTEFAKMVQANPVFSILHFLYAIVLALAGRAEDARPAVARGLELELEPSFCSRLIYQVGIAREIADRLAEGARILGLPE
jgi:TolB-like protein/Tfp pilus assembly protein PilF